MSCTDPIYSSTGTREENTSAQKDQERALTTNTCEFLVMNGDPAGYCATLKEAPPMRSIILDGHGGIHKAPGRPGAISTLRMQLAAASEPGAVAEGVKAVRQGLAPTLPP